MYSEIKNSDLEILDFLNTFQSPIETGRTNFSIANTPKNVFATDPSHKRLSYTGRNRLQHQVERKIRSKTGSDGKSFFPTFQIIKTLVGLVKVTIFKCGSWLTEVKYGNFCHLTVMHFYVKSKSQTTLNNQVSNTTSKQLLVSRITTSPSLNQSAKHVSTKLIT